MEGSRCDGHRHGAKQSSKTTRGQEDADGVIGMGQRDTVGEDSLGKIRQRSQANGT